MRILRANALRYEVRLNELGVPERFSVSLDWTRCK